MTSPDVGARGALERSLARLADAADAAEALGLKTDEVRTAHAEALDRLGFPSDIYVLAFVGGTGVGKSSLLNALAGSMVSRASALRPTTAHAVAWVPRGARDDLAELLRWLEVTDVREHERGTWDSVAILDLPDMDSLATAHRDVVEQLLPRVDAVAWITDPEKYHDAVLHDDFLRRWLAKLARQAIVLNKTDLLSADDVERVRLDLERDLRHGLAGGSGPGELSVPVIAVSATGGPDGIRAFSDWLAQGVEGKAVVRGRVSATIAAHARELARDAGVDPAAPLEPFLDPAARREVANAVTAAVLRVIDLPALELQAVAATRAQARRRGTGPVGGLTSLVYRLSGREARVADPDSFLVRWRDRGPLTPAVESLRVALAEPIRAAAPAVRPALAAAVEPVQLRRGLEAAVDRAVNRHDRTPPSSRMWTVLGLLQTLSTAAIVLSVVWMIVWLVARPEVDSAILPVIGRVPMPLVALVVSLLAGYVLARSLGLHAGWVGRRWAARLRSGIATEVAGEVEVHGLEPLDRLETARRELWAATQDVQSGDGSSTWAQRVSSRSARL